MALLATASKWRSRRYASARLSPATASTMPEPHPGEGGGTSPAAHGLGKGPPPSAQRASAAPMLHGDAQHTHRAAGRAPHTAPEVVWSHDVGGPVEAQVTASSDEQTLYVASLGGSLRALARESGVERWALTLGDRAY